MPMPDPDYALTLDEVRKLPAAIDVNTAARAFNVHRSSAYQSIAEDTFPAEIIHVNGRILVLTASVLRVLEGKSKAQAA